MKSLEELKRIREEAAKKMNMRNQVDGYRVVVGMATCGIAAGARPVLNALVEEVAKRDLRNVTVTQVGCIGKCSLEPIVEVFDANGGRYTYCKVTANDASKIIEQHIINGTPVESMLISNYEK